MNLHRSISFFFALAALVVTPICQADVVEEFNAPYAPKALAADLDGSIWYTGAEVIGHIGADGVLIGTYALPATTTIGQIAQGDDNRMWFSYSIPESAPGAGDSEAGIAAIAANGTITRYAGLIGTNPMAAGLDGSLWHIGSSNITHFATDGTGQQFDVPQFDSIPGSASPNALVAGPDGNMWYVDRFADWVGKISPSGDTTTYKITPESAANSITAGPDGALWFTSEFTGEISRITTVGVITKFTLTNEAHGLYAITTGPDKLLWYISKNGLGRMTVKGNAEIISSRTDLNLGADDSRSIVTGSDGSVWFAIASSNKIGRVTQSHDLVLSASALKKSGMNTTTTLTLVHNGNTPTGKSIQVKAYLSKDKTLDRRDVILLNKRVSTLSANQTKTFKVSTTTSTSKGKYILACADCAGVIAESDEKNNKTSSVKIK